MPNATPKGFPYPVGTDFLAQGDDAIKALAEALDAFLFTPTAWIYPALGAGWSTPSGPGSGPIAYAKDLAGNVHVQGIITSPATAGAYAWTMPVGYRPPLVVGGFAINVTTNGWGALDVAATGEVNVSASGTMFIVNAVYSTRAR
jgi:hypothetical protein